MGGTRATIILDRLETELRQLTTINPKAAIEAQELLDAFELIRQGWGVEDAFVACFGGNIRLLREGA